MKDYNEIIEQFEQYLDGELDATAQKKLEVAMKDDSNLAKALEEHKLLLAGIRYSARNNLKEKLVAFDEQLPPPMIPESASEGTGKLNWYYIAAAVLLLVVSGIAFYNYNFSAYDRIADNYYKPHEHVTSGTRGGNNSEPTQAIAELYDQEKYLEVINIASQMSESERSEEVLILQASALMAMKNYDQAISVFEHISKVSSIYKTESMWYLSLSYLYKNKVDAAVPLLNELAMQKSSSYSSKAEKLLEDLK